jgi:hypothetical protein
MTDYRKLERIRKDPLAVQALARKALRNLDGQLSDWEQDFLRKLETFEGPQPLSQRQAEKLLLIDDRASRSPTMGGYRASTLMRALWQGQLDLDEAEEEFVARKCEEGAALALSRNEWRFTFALCHKLALVEDYVQVA